MQPASLSIRPGSNCLRSSPPNYARNLWWNPHRVLDVNEARAIALEGRPLPSRPKDSHDILGVFRQALEPGWRNQTLAAGEPVLEQIKDLTQTIGIMKSCNAFEKSRMQFKLLFPDELK